jgi:hypothetical protein
LGRNGQAGAGAPGQATARLAERGLLAMTSALLRGGLLALFLTALVLALRQTLGVFLRSVFGGEARRPEPSRARLRLEGLEERCNPSDLYWVGGTTGNTTGWGNAHNWIEDYGFSFDYADAAPTSSDNVFFNAWVPYGSGDAIALLNGNAYDCVRTTGLAADTTICNDMTVAGGFSKTVDLVPTFGGSTHKTIINDDLTINTSGSAFELVLGEGLKLTVIDEFVWDQEGDIDFSDNNALATITADHLNWTMTASSALGANVVAKGVGGASVINIDFSLGLGIDYQLELYKGAVLTNEGSLFHSRGRINERWDDPAREQSYVKNALGASWTKDTNTTTTVSMSFVNYGTLTVDAGTYSIDDYSSSATVPGGGNYGYYQSGPFAVTQITAGAKLKATAGVDFYMYFDGGSFYTLNSGMAYIDVGSGAAAFNGTAIKLNQNENGGYYGKLSFTGSMHLLGGTTYYCDVDNTTALKCDTITMEGETKFVRDPLVNPDQTISVIRHGAAPPAGRIWNVFATTARAAAPQDDWDRKTLDGLTGAWVTIGPYEVYQLNS